MEDSLQDYLELIDYMISNEIIENEGDYEYGNWFKDLPEDYTISKELFLRFSCDYLCWEFESQEKFKEKFKNKYANDKEFISDYLNNTDLGNDLFYLASEEIQGDYELLKKYAGFIYPEIGYANHLVALNDNIVNNRTLMLRLLADVPVILMDLKEEFQDDEEFISTAINKDGTLLKFASKRIQDDKKIVAKAIENNIEAVLYASKRLREFPDGIFYEHYWHVINGVEFKK